MKNDISKRTFRLAEILAALYTGSQTEADEKELRDWVEESEANRKTADRILNAGNFDKNEALLREFTRGAEEVKPHIAASFAKPAGAEKIPRHVKRIIAYAATVALLVCGGGGIYYMSDRGGNEQQDIFHPAGSTGAILTMDDGSTRILSDEESEGQMILSNGKNIVVHSNGVDYSAIADSPPTTAFNTIETRRGMEYSIVLDDGTKVFLNAESKLRFPCSFLENVREVYLSGEAYFEVAKDRNRPFVIRAQETNVTVLGTTFNMRAYEDESAIVTTLVEGKVAVTCKTGRMEIGPGEQAVYSKTTELLTAKQVDLSLHTSWRTGKFLFRNEPLENILADISRWYSFEYRFADDHCPKIRVGASFDRYDSMDPIINMLRSTGLVSISHDKDGTLVISQTK